MTTAAPSAASILAARSCGKSGCACVRARKVGHGNTHCPCHDDETPSLSVSEQHGKTLWRCMAGCDKRAVTVAILREVGEPVQAVSRPEPVSFRYAYSVNGSGTFYHVRLEPVGKPKVMWWEAADGTRGTGGVRVETFPLWRGETLAERPDELVLVLEGEAKTDVAQQHGHLAVSLAGGSSKLNYVATLRPLAGRDVILLPDNDLPGRDFMKHLAGLLSGTARSVRILPLPGLEPAGDLVDWYAAGHTDDELQALIAGAKPVAQPAPAASASGRVRPRIVTGTDILNVQLPAVQPVVEGLLTEGGMLLAGRPKLGKSWLALGIGLAIAAGGMAMGKLPVLQGDVLWMALEDGERRAQKRIRTVLCGEPMPALFHAAYTWPRLDEGGLEDLDWWLSEHQGARLVVVDTLKRVRAREAPNKRLYDLDYDAVGPLADLAKARGVCILIVHHTNKSQSDDPLDLISGSTGLTGAVDGAMVLKRMRGERTAELVSVHRDFEDQDLALAFEQAPFGWMLTGTADEARRSEEQKSILQVIGSSTDDRDQPVIKPVDIAAQLGKNRGTVRRLLAELKRDGLVIGSEQGYALSPKGRVSYYPHDQRDQHEQPPPSPDHADHADRPVHGARSDQGVRGDRYIYEAARDPHRVPDSQDDPALDYVDPALCPAGCGVSLRDGWCPLCGGTFREESP